MTTIFKLIRWYDNDYLPCEEMYKEETLIYKYSLDSKFINVVRDIIIQFPDSWKNRKRFKALLFDFLTSDKLMRNLIMGCFDNEIVSDLVKYKNISKVQEFQLARRLVYAYGCSIDIAETIVQYWIEAFGINFNEERIGEKSPIIVRISDVNDDTNFDGCVW